MINKKPVGARRARFVLWPSFFLFGISSLAPQD